MAIKICNLPANVNHSELIAFLTKLGIQVKEIKPMSERHSDKSETTEYVILKEGEDEFKAMTAIQGQKWGDKELSAHSDDIYTAERAADLPSKGTSSDDDRNRNKS